MSEENKKCMNLQLFTAESMALAMLLYSKNIMLKKNRSNGNIYAVELKESLRLVKRGQKWKKYL